jgi:hypothetical protein
MTQVLAGLLDDGDFTQVLQRLYDDQPSDTSL